MESSLSIGIVIPCYIYHLPKLELLLDSINSQTIKPSKVIVSCSSTKSEQMYINCHKYNFPLFILTTEMRLNASQNRNLGSSYIDTDIISYFDADDIMHPQRIEIILNSFQKYNPNIILHSYLCNEETKNQFDKYENEIPIIENRLIKSPTGCAVISYDFSLRIHHSQVSIKREIFDKIKFREEKEYERKEDSIFCGDVLGSEYGKKNIYINLGLSKYYEEGVWHS